MQERHRGWSHRTIPWVLGTAVAFVVAGCESPQAPDATAPEFDRMREQLEPIKDYLGGAAYRVFFGHDASAGGVGYGLNFGMASGKGPPRDGNDVLVNDPTDLAGIGQSEVTIAAHGGTIVLAWNDAKGFFGPPSVGLDGWGISTDRGKTFTDGGSFPPHPTLPGLRRSGDPALAVDNGGTFFFADLCIDFSTGVSALCVTVGEATGGTVNWGSPVLAASACCFADFLDKELIAVDRQGNDVYVSYTRFGPPFFNGQIEVVASHDGGATFGPPVIVQPGLPFAVNQGSEPAVGPNGELYVVWESDWLTSVTPRILIRKSTDGGATFGPTATVATIGTQAFFPPSGYNRGVINDFPRIDVARTGPNRGDVYVTYHSGPPGDGDIFVATSSDGTSWSTVQVSDDGPGAKQWWPDLAVEPGGNVSVMWYDRRLNPGTALTDVFWSQSTDGGATFRPNLRVSDVSTDWSATATDITPNFGDYNGIFAGGNRSYAGWADGRLGTPDVFFSELLGAGKSR